MYSSNLLSHPGKLLENHLINVSKFTEIFLNEKPKYIVENYNKLCKVVALSHDIGKATKFFQNYLKMVSKNVPDKEINEEIKRLKNLPETKHSLFSALCGYFLAKELKLSNELLPFFAFIAIKKHHGDLSDISYEAIIEEKDIDNLYKQLESIDDKNFSILADELFKAGLPLVLKKEIIEKWISEFQNELKCIKRKIRKLDNNIENFVTLNFIYSILLDADKSDAVGIDPSKFYKREDLPSDIVDKAKKFILFPETPINYLKEKAYNEVIQKQIDINQKIYLINLPTGLGKTLSSLSFALKLREKIGEKHRIVYALPFLSIIDQNASVFESILEKNDITPYNNILLKHHHLSDFTYKEYENEFETDEAKILIEGWNSEIIVTTFVQLFHSIISNKNKSLRKFHRLANSIIILDEVQAIPIKYWRLIKEILLLLSEKFNTYIIIVTATEPLIFKKEEVDQLVEKNFYFKSLDRIKMISLLERDMTIQELYEQFNLKENKSYLFIFNTISAAYDFYSMIKNLGLPITYLSTHVIPKERLKRIKEIREGKYKIVVSTQLVEAGVDIDFDVVVRDIAPFDSIMQSSGRCNRNYLKRNEKGEIYIVSLKDNKNRLYSSYIYDPILIDITREILKDYKEINENQLIHLIEEYYEKVSKRKSQDEDIIEAVSKLKYDSEDDFSIERFKLIEDKYPELDVFIEIDEEAKKVWSNYYNLKNIENLFERKKKFNQIKSQLYQYIISIPISIKNKPPMIGKIGYIGYKDIKNYYNFDTGYIREDNTIIF